jgi:hypothetical protein
MDCQARKLPGRNQSGNSRSGFHARRRHLVAGLADWVLDRLVEHVANLGLLRRLAGGQDSPAAAAVVAAIAELIDSERSPAGV